MIYLFTLVGRGRLELPTNGLKVRRAHPANTAVRGRFAAHGSPDERFSPIGGRNSPRNLLQSFRPLDTISVVNVWDHCDNRARALTHALHAPKTGTVVPHWKRSSKGFCVSGRCFVRRLAQCHGDISKPVGRKPGRATPQAEVAGSNPAASHKASSSPEARHWHKSGPHVVGALHESDAAHNPSGPALCRDRSEQASRPTIATGPRYGCLEVRMHRSWRVVGRSGLRDSETVGQRLSCRESRGYLSLKGKAMQYEVLVRCVVERTVTCEGCTEAQARENPFEFAVDESYGEVVDYEVRSVTKSE